MKKFIIIFSLFSTLGIASEVLLDQKIQHYVKQFQLRPLGSIPKERKAVVILGRELFFSKTLSGNKNISCSTCHHPKFGSSDGLPLPIGEGGMGTGNTRFQGRGKVIPRNAPDLFNRGYPSFDKMFWDSRVSMNVKKKTFSTPEPSFNGVNPKNKVITRMFSTALDAQAIFPLVSHDEMRGKKGTNEIADAPNNLIAWQRIVQRVLNDYELSSLLRKAYPGVRKFNIGHIGRAIGAFESVAFKANNTQWDKYLRGSRVALDLKSKKGFLVFVEKGQCINCHNGAHFTNLGFRSVATPQIGPGKNKKNKDYGLYHLTKNPKHKYLFKVPPLRNLIFTAPYMHDGSLLTLKEVIDHYDEPFKSLDAYSTDKIENKYSRNYNRTLNTELDLNELTEIKKFATPILRGHQKHFTDIEKDQLLHFLTFALTDRSFQRRFMYIMDMK